LNGFSPAILEAYFNAAIELHAEIANENANFKKVTNSMKRLINGSR